jgi:hypothetical protein
LPKLKVPSSTSFKLADQLEKITPYFSGTLSRGVSPSALNQSIKHTLSRRSRSRSNSRFMSSERKNLKHQLPSLRAASPQAKKYATIKFKRKIPLPKRQARVGSLSRKPNEQLATQPRR